MLDFDLLDFTFPFLVTIGRALKGAKAMTYYLMNVPIQISEWIQKAGTIKHPSVHTHCTLHSVTFVEKKVMRIIKNHELDVTLYSVH